MRRRRECVARHVIGQLRSSGLVGQALDRHGGLSPVGEGRCRHRVLHEDVERGGRLRIAEVEDRAGDALRGLRRKFGVEARIGHERHVAGDGVSADVRAIEDRHVLEQKRLAGAVDVDDEADVGGVVRRRGDAGVGRDRHVVLVERHGDLVDGQQLRRPHPQPPEGVRLGHSRRCGDEDEHGDRPEGDRARWFSQAHE